LRNPPWPNTFTIIPFSPVFNSDSFITQLILSAKLHKKTCNPIAKAASFYKIPKNDDRLLGFEVIFELSFSTRVLVSQVANYVTFLKQRNAVRDVDSVGEIVA